MVDGDTVFEPDTVTHLVQPFADPGVGAVAGNTKVANRRRLLGRWQHIEYVMGFNLDRRMYEQLRCMPTVPGAIGAFRRCRARRRRRSHRDDTLAEDTDLTMAIGRAGWRVVYEQRAIAWTEAPATLGQLWRQRYRWSYGTMQAMWKHRGALRPRRTLTARPAGLPYLFMFQVLLPMLAPVIDVFAVYGLLFLDPGPVARRLARLHRRPGASSGCTRSASTANRPATLLTLPLQQVVYRQLLYLVTIHSVGHRRPRRTAAMAQARSHRRLHRRAPHRRRHQLTARKAGCRGVPPFAARESGRTRRL